MPHFRFCDPSFMHCCQMKYFKSKRELAGWVFALVWALAGVRCGLDREAPPAFRNLGPEARYVGKEVCRSCHPQQYADFAQTGMGQSWGRAPEHSTAVFGPHAVVYDSVRHLWYHPFLRDSAMYVLEYRLEGADTTYRRIERIDYVVGSGQHTHSHLIERNGYLFQAPVTWYAQEARWGLAPGFSEWGNPRFSRWIGAECVTCHNHLPEQVPGSLNKFRRLPLGIECERCHGPGSIHVAEKRAGIAVDTSRTADNSIVNPRRLPRRLQLDLCQRCHLQGLALLRPGKTFYDFRPGMALDSVMQVWLPRWADDDQRFIMASQADRLRQSACFRESEELTCLSCHHPHHSVRQTPRRHFNAACRKCHSGAAEAVCSAPPQELARAEADCVQCHMPASGTTDIPHVRITDHLIGRAAARRHLFGESPPQENKGFRELRLLSSGRATPLERARAFLALYDKYLPAPFALDSAAWYLTQADPRSAGYPDVRVHLLFNRAAYDTLLALAQRWHPQQIDDAWTAYRLAEAALQRQVPHLALQWMKRALDHLPLHLDFREKLGVAQLAARRFAEAKATFLRVLAEYPDRPLSCLNLGWLAARAGDLQEARAWYRRALALDPDYEQAQRNLAALDSLERAQR